MKNELMTDEQFVEMLNWEGAAYAFTGCGLSEKDLDPDSELWALAATCSVFAKSFADALDAFKNRCLEMDLEVEF